MMPEDHDMSGTIDFDEFANFCTKNLLHLEREKQIKSLHLAMHKDVEQMFDTEGHLMKEKEDSLSQHLLSLFRLADKAGSGILDFTAVESLFESLDVHLTPFELSCVMQEADTSHDGLIQVYFRFHFIEREISQIKLFSAYAFRAHFSVCIILTQDLLRANFVLTEYLRRTFY